MGNTIWIIGAGRFGRRAAEALGKRANIALIDAAPHPGVAADDGGIRPPADDGGIRSPANDGGIRSPADDGGNRPPAAGEGIRPLSVDGSIRRVTADGVDYLVRRLSPERRRDKKGHSPDAEGPPDWIIPAVPIHLAFEWIRARLAPAHAIRPATVPAAILGRLPHPMAAPDAAAPGSRFYVSHADFICPPDCPEPADRCSHTGRPRPESLFRRIAGVFDVEGAGRGKAETESAGRGEAVAEVAGRGKAETETAGRGKAESVESAESMEVETATPGWRAVVIRSHQLAPGVGGYRPGQLFAALDAVAVAGAGPGFRNVLVATACRCHGVMDAIAIGPRNPIDSRNDPV